MDPWTLNLVKHLKHSTTGMPNWDLNFHGYNGFIFKHVATAIIKILVQTNIVNLMEKWCLDTVRWSKTGIFCRLYISFYLHEVIPAWYVVIRSGFPNGTITCCHLSQRAWWLWSAGVKIINHLLRKGKYSRAPYRWVIRSKIYYGYMKPRIIPKVIYNMIFV
jgi:hypothetical protein